MKEQMRFQKAICLFALIASALCFVYALGFMTDVYEQLYYYSKEGGTPTVAGANTFYDLQPFNGQLLTVTIVGILVNLLLFITMTNKRRRYYITNYIAIGACLLYGFGCPVYFMSQIANIKVAYIEGIDWEALQARTEIYGLKYSESTFWFDANYFVFGVMIIATVLLVVNLFWKVKLMKQEDKLLAQ